MMLPSAVMSAPETSASRNSVVTSSISTGAEPEVNGPRNTNASVRDFVIR